MRIPYPLSEERRRSTQEIMKRVKKSDVIIGAITLGLAIFVYIETLGFPKTVITPGIPPASFFPRILAGLLGLSSILLIIFGIRAKPEAPQAIKWRGIVRVVVAMVLMTVYVILMPDIGFFILTPFLLAPLMVIMGERDWKLIVAIGLLFILVAYFVFFRFFGIMFPTKIFM